MWLKKITCYGIFLKRICPNFLSLLEFYYSRGLTDISKIHLSLTSLETSLFNFYDCNYLSYFSQPRQPDFISSRFSVISQDWFPFLVDLVPDCTSVYKQTWTFDCKQTIKKVCVYFKFDNFSNFYVFP